MRKLEFILFLSTVVALSSCATVTRESNSVPNWIQQQMLSEPLAQTQAQTKSNFAVFSHDLTETWGESHTLRWNHWLAQQASTHFEVLFHIEQGEQAASHLARAFKHWRQLRQCDRCESFQFSTRLVPDLENGLFIRAAK